MMELFRSSHPDVFLVKGVLKISNKFTGEHPCRIVISIKLQSSFIKITLWHGCSVSLLHIFATPSPRNTSGWLLLKHIYGNSLTTLNYFFLKQLLKRPFAKNTSGRLLLTFSENSESFNR